MTSSIFEILTLNYFNGAEEYKNYGSADWEYFIKLRLLSKKIISINPALYLSTLFKFCKYKYIEAYSIAKLTSLAGDIIYKSIFSQNCWSEGETIVFQWIIENLPIAFLIYLRGHHVFAEQSYELNSQLIKNGFKSLKIVFDKDYWRMLAGIYLKLLILPAMIIYNRKSLKSS